MSRAGYAVGITLMQVLSLLSGVFLTHPDVQRSTDGSLAVLAAAGMSGVIGAFLFLSLVYRMWARVQDGQARTTPGKATLFLFIPLFNIVWLFVVLVGYARDYNAYVERNAIGSAPRLSGGLMALFALLILVPIPFIHWVVTYIAVARLVGAANAVGSA